MSKLEKAEQLIKQIKKGKVEKALEIIAEGQVNVNFIDKKSGKNLLQLVIQAEENQLFDALLSKPQININLSNSEGSQSIIQTAILFENLDAINKLLSKGVNIVETNSKNQTAIDIATIQNKATVLDIFWKFNNEPIIKDALRLCKLGFQNNSDQVCIFLITKIPLRFLTMINEEGNNIIHMAVEANKTQIVKQILNRINSSEELTEVEKEFAWNTQNKKGDTYLHIAYRNQYQTMINLLEDPSYKVFINKEIKNQKGETIKGIVRKNELSKESQIKRQEKLREQKKQKEIQKQQMRKRQAQIAEKQKVQQKKAAQRKVKQQEIAQQKDVRKSKYILLGVVILVLILTYLGLDYVASKPRQSGML